MVRLTTYPVINPEPQGLIPPGKMSSEPLEYSQARKKGQEIVIDRKLLILPIFTNLIVITLSEPADIVKAPGNSFYGTSYLHFTGHLAVAKRVAWIVASLICKAIELPTTLTFEIGSASVSVPI